MHFNNIFNIFVVILIATSPAVALAIDKRAELNYSGNSAIVQWSDASGNHLRSYHIRSDCTVVENSHNSGSSGWITNTLPFCANPEWKIVATLVSGGFNQLPERIQLFFTDRNKDRTVSAFWTANTSWRSDTEFNAMNVDTWQGAAISFRPAPGFIAHMRLYTTKYMIGSIVDNVFVELSEIYEFIWIQEVGWSVANLGKPVLKTLGDARKSGIAAVTGDDGSLIRMFYFKKKGSALPNAYSVSHAVYTAASPSWQDLGTPYSRLEGFHNIRGLTAVRWGDGTPGGIQIRLYVHYQEYSGTHHYTEFEVSDNKWHEPKDLPSYVLDRLTTGNPASVVWTYPDWNQVHIRLYNPRTHIDGNAPYIHETAFDTGAGWKDGADLPA